MDYQKKEAEKKAIGEYHVILFICEADKLKYLKLIKVMKNNILRKKAMFQRF